MRLLRLTTRNETATFESNYNSDIILEPRSKIALQSVSIDTVPNVLTLGSTNNTIAYQIINNYSKTISLAERQYFSGQVVELLQDIEDELNNSVDYVFASTPTNKPLGLEWNVALVNKKIQIGYDIGRAGDWFAQTKNSWVFTNSSKSSATGGGFLVGGDTSSSVNTNPFRSFCVFPYPLSKGNGYFRARVGRLVYNASGSGYIMGLLEDADKATNPDESLTLADVIYGIEINVESDDTTRYAQIIVNGVRDSTKHPIADYTADSADNDYFEVEINGGFIQMNQYFKNDSGGTTQKTFNSGEDIYEPKVDLFPCFMWLGKKSEAQANAVRITPSPYGKNKFNPDLSTITESQDGFNAPPQQPNPSPTNENFIEFSGDLGSYLGFNTSKLPPTGTLKDYTITYKAPNDFVIPEDADAMLVQLMNLQIESYDSFSTSAFPSGGQRKNILSVIPTSIGGRIIYEPPYPTFLDLNNEERIYLRNINLRVVKEDYSDILINGLGSVVLLIE